MLRRVVTISLFLAVSQSGPLAQAQNFEGRWVLDADKNSQVRGAPLRSRAAHPNAAIVVRKVGLELEIEVEGAESGGPLRNAKVRAVADGQRFRQKAASGAATSEVRWYREESYLVREQNVQLHGQSNRQWVTFRTYYRRG